MTDTLLSVSDLTVRYAGPRRFGLRASAGITAVDAIAFTLNHGQALGIVGESGSGKSSAARAIARLIPAASGRILLNGTDLAPLTGAALRAARAPLAMIFQDPAASLNPRWTAARLISEPMLARGSHNPRDAQHEAERLMERVGLDIQLAQRYPHEFSGGQRQRIGIARALAAQPQLLICDEAVSALDVSVQAQIINLLDDLRHDLNLALLFIAHDLSVVRHLCDDVAVMQRGRIVERGNAQALFDNPQDPYTQQLLAAVPQIPDFA